MCVGRVRGRVLKRLAQALGADLGDFDATLQDVKAFVVAFAEMRERVAHIEAHVCSTPGCARAVAVQGDEP
jgi:hypothetical protein